MTMACKARELILGRSLRALEIENDMAVRHSAAGQRRRYLSPGLQAKSDMDVMWKAPWGMKETARGFDYTPSIR